MRVRASRIPRLFGAHAMAIHPWVLVVPERLLDLALIAHEEVHLREQAQMGRVRWWWRYLTNRDFRFEAEVRAYRVQLARGGSPLTAAHYLSTLYRLDISFTEALIALTAPPQDERI